MNTLRYTGALIVVAMLTPVTAICFAAGLSTGAVALAWRQGQDAARAMFGRAK